MAPQMSPLVTVCAVGLSRSQSGTKLALRSVQLRVTEFTTLTVGTAAVIGAVCADSPSRYLFRLTLTAVLPLPNTSRTSDSRGDQSFHPRMSWPANTRLRRGAKNAGN